MKVEPSSVLAHLGTENKSGLHSCIYVWCSIKQGIVQVVVSQDLSCSTVNYMNVVDQSIDSGKRMFQDESSEAGACFWKQALQKPAVPKQAALFSL